VAAPAQARIAEARRGIVRQDGDQAGRRSGGLHRPSDMIIGRCRIDESECGPDSQPGSDVTNVQQHRSHR